jgi:hypothetical protein
LVFQIVSLGTTEPVEYRRDRRWVTRLSEPKKL